MVKKFQRLSSKFYWMKYSSIDDDSEGLVDSEENFHEEELTGNDLSQEVNVNTVGENNNDEEEGSNEENNNINTVNDADANQNNSDEDLNSNDDDDSTLYPQPSRRNSSKMRIM